MDYDRPLQPGETRYFPGGNSVHMHTGRADCPCGNPEGRGGAGSVPGGHVHDSPVWCSCGWRLGGNGGPNYIFPLEGPLR